MYYGRKAINSPLPFLILLLPFDHRVEFDRLLLDVYQRLRVPVNLQLHPAMAVIVDVLVNVGGLYRIRFRTGPFEGPIIVKPPALPAR